METRARAFRAFGSQSKNSCRKYLGKKRRERWALYNFLTSNTNTYAVQSLSLRKAGMRTSDTCTYTITKQSQIKSQHRVGGNHNAFSDQHTVPEHVHTHHDERCSQGSRSISHLHSMAECKYMVSSSIDESTWQRAVVGDHTKGYLLV